MRYVLAFLIFLAGPLGHTEPGPQNSILTLDITGPVDPATKDHVLDGIKRASDMGAQAVLIRLDTPGGLLDATRDIVSGILNAPLPVIVFIGPAGARAASAGVFITLAADVAVMAPETHLGAAHPVNLGGGNNQTPISSTATASAMDDKILSDTAAYIRGLATARGRNAAWAEEAVRRSVSATAEEALKLSVVDFLAPDTDALLKKLDGKTVKKNGRDFTLQTKSAALIAFEMNALRRALHVIAHPNVAYLLLVLGFYALIYELASPGVGLGGIVGITCLVLAFFSLQVLPLSFAGLILLISGIVLMALDVLLVSHGLLMAAGLVAFGLGSVMLIENPGSMLGRVSLSLVAGTLVGTALYFGGALRAIVRTRHEKPKTGVETLIGAAAEVRPEGMVFVQGALWVAEGLGDAAVGESVTVTEVRGNRLRVEKIPK